jgi:Cu/Ag efflux protein CusF
MEMKQGVKIEGSMKMEMATEGIFEGEGRVVAVVPGKGQIVLEHEEIKGFMKAMTMGYPVESMTLMKGLESGDAVKFEIDAGRKTIIAVERMEK